VPVFWTGGRSGVNQKTKKINPTQPKITQRKKDSRGELNRIRDGGGWFQIPARRGRGRGKGEGEEAVIKGLVGVV